MPKELSEYCTGAVTNALGILEEAANLMEGYVMGAEAKAAMLLDMVQPNINISIGDLFGLAAAFEAAVGLVNGMVLAQIEAAKALVNNAIQTALGPAMAQIAKALEGIEGAEQILSNVESIFQNIGPNFASQLEKALIDALGYDKAFEIINQIRDIMDKRFILPKLTLPPNPISSIMDEALSPMRTLVTEIKDALNPALNCML